MKILVGSHSNWNNNLLVERELDKLQQLYPTEFIDVVSVVSDTDIERCINTYQIQNTYSRNLIRYNLTEMTYLECIEYEEFDFILIFTSDTWTVEKFNLVDLARYNKIPYKIISDSGQVFDERKFYDTLIVTHTDLDGIGSEILLKTIYPESDSIRVNYDYESNESLVATFQHYKRIIFGDMSFSKELFSRVFRELMDDGVKVLVFDHHQSVVDEFEDILPILPTFIIDTSRSATKIIYDMYKDIEPKIKVYDEFVTLVNDYDMWIHDDPRSIELHLTFDGYTDKNLFRDRWLMTPDLTPSHMDKIAYKSSYNSLVKSIAMILDNIEILTDVEGNRFGLCQYDRNFSLSAHTILNKDDLDIDYLVGYHHHYKSTLSFRSPTGGVIVREIAEKLGGGGHDHSSGANVVDGMDIKESVINHEIIFKF